MRRRTARAVPDVFETFAHRVDDSAEGPIEAPAVGVVARSAGIGLALMVLTSFAFVAGAWLASRARPDLVFSNLAWEGLVIAGWSLLWGALAAAIVLAAGVVAVGLPWVRRQRGARSTPTSTP
ncbi:MAG TPA: hypothetical protein VLA55_06950 [Ornithinibacter sp.]|nr:hypothetical protein [Ornithinibacter sp.]